MLAVEIVRAAWRLHRCVVAESEDGANLATQASVDRARASAHNSMRHLLKDLRESQSDRWLRAEVLREGFDEAHIGIADAHRVIKGLSDNERLKSQFFMAPIGIDPINQTDRTQSVGQAILSPANLGHHPSRDCQGVGDSTRAQASQASAAATIRTQSVGQALSPGNPSPVPDPQPLIPVLDPQPLIPRNAPCPCHSGLKYKRCCGVTAPPVLTSFPNEPFIS